MFFLSATRETMNRGNHDFSIPQPFAVSRLKVPCSVRSVNRAENGFPSSFHAPLSIDARGGLACLRN
jgi:hypothetical protein